MLLKITFVWLLTVIKRYVNVLIVNFTLQSSKSLISVVCAPIAMLSSWSTDGVNINSWSVHTTRTNVDVVCQC